MLILAMLSMNLLYVVNLVADKAIAVVEEKIEVSVYFKPETPQDHAVSAQNFLRGLVQVRDVNLVTAEESLNQFKLRHATDERVLASLSAIDTNPFGPSLVIKAHKASDFPAILEALDHPQFRDEIREKDFSDYHDIIERIRHATDRIRSFGIGLSVVFLFIAVLIVFNTIRIGIFIHREEIGIMKLVGASSAFVRVPYLLESIFYSLIATGVVMAILLPLTAVLDPKLTQYLGTSVGLLDEYQTRWYQIFGLQFAALALLNLFSTGLAIRKYLRV